MIYFKNEYEQYFNMNTLLSFWVAANNTIILQMNLSVSVSETIHRARCIELGKQKRSAPGVSDSTIRRKIRSAQRILKIWMKKNDMCSTSAYFLRTNLSEQTLKDCGIFDIIVDVIKRDELRFKIRAVAASVIEKKSESSAENVDGDIDMNVDPGDLAAKEPESVEKSLPPLSTNDDYETAFFKLAKWLNKKSRKKPLTLKQILQHWAMLVGIEEAKFDSLLPLLRNADLTNGFSELPETGAQLLKVGYLFFIT